MPPKFAARGGPRKSNASTPAPSDNEPTLADKLNYYDTPRPFKNPNFASRLPLRTASSAPGITTGFKKNVKQVLNLERERVSGGDGFLTAAQTAARARGESLDVIKKKKKENPIGRRIGVPGGGGGGRGRRSGWNTPLTVDDESLVGGSGSATPLEDEEGDERIEIDSEIVVEVTDTDPDVVVRREIITYHTPLAPPSLLPAKKYCDITGLHAAYTDPRTKLRYKGLEVWQIVRNLGPGVDQTYLALRGAQTSLK